MIREDIGAQRLEEAGVPPRQLQVAISNVSAMHMLEHGRVELWAYSEDVAFWLMQEHGLPTTDYMPVLTISESDLYYALHRHTDPALVDQMQQALDALNRHGVLGDILGSNIVFNTEDYPPYNHRAADGSITGRSTERLRQALKSAGLSAHFRLLPWARAFTEAQLRERHCVYSTTRTPEREPLFIWIGPLATSTWAAFTRPGSRVRAATLDELSGLRVGVPRRCGGGIRHRTGCSGDHGHGRAREPGAPARRADRRLGHRGTGGAHSGPRSRRRPAPPF